MSELQKRKHSSICAGSVVNDPESFAEDESWSCGDLQSTIFAGMNMDSPKETQKNVEAGSRRRTDGLATINEERDNTMAMAFSSSFVSPLEDSNILNQNLDAMKDDGDVFFDCPMPNMLSPVVCTPKATKTDSDEKSKAAESCNSHRRKPSIFTFSSNLDSCTGASEDRTGALLALQLANDFNTLAMKSQPKSTPNVDDSPSASVSQVVSSRTIDDASKPGQKMATKRDKWLLDLHDRSPLARLPMRLRSPSLLGTSGRVAEMKKVYDRSPSARRALQPIAANKPAQQPRPVLRKNKQSPPVYQSSSGVSCSSHGHSSCSIISAVARGKVAAIKRSMDAAVAAKDQLPASGAPKLQRTKPVKRSAEATTKVDSRAVHKRPASTSDCLPSSPPYVCSPNSRERPCQRQNNRQRRRRSRSASAIESSSSSCSPSSSLEVVSRSVMKAYFVTVRQYRTRPKQPNQSLQVGRSSIMNRRSLGFVSSPIKPVKMLRGIFSPRQQSGEKGQKKSAADKNNMPNMNISTKMVTRGDSFLQAQKF